VGRGGFRARGRAGFAVVCSFWLATIGYLLFGLAWRAAAAGDCVVSALTHNSGDVCPSSIIDIAGLIQDALIVSTIQSTISIEHRRELLR
jgi:hypothetical protein